MSVAAHLGGNPGAKIQKNVLVCVGNPTLPGGGGGGWGAAALCTSLGAHSAHSALHHSRQGFLSHSFDAVWRSNTPYGQSDAVQIVQSMHPQEYQRSPEGTCFILSGGFCAWPGAHVRLKYPHLGIAGTSVGLRTQPKTCAHIGRRQNKHKHTSFPCDPHFGIEMPFYPLLRLAMKHCLKLHRNCACDIPAQN